MKEKIDENSHWNFAEEFTGREAAHLICGYDPSLNDVDISNKVQPVIKRLKNSYYNATKSFSTVDQGLFSIVSIKESKPAFRIFSLYHWTPRQSQIWSVEMETLIEEYNYLHGTLISDKHIEHEVNNDIEEVGQKENVVRYIKFTDNFRLIDQMMRPMRKWVDDYIHEFDDQKFSRVQLSRWINENNFPSHYSFSTVNPSERALRSNERNTLLIIIGALCKRLDLQYDPLDSNTVAKVMALVSALGVNLSDPTIRDKLHKISAAVDHNRTTP